MSRSGRYGLAIGGWIFSHVMLFAGHPEIALFGLLGPAGALALLWHEERARP